MQRMRSCNSKNWSLSPTIAETCQFLMIQALECQEIWQKNSLETTWMIYYKKFWIFLNKQK